MTLAPPPPLRLSEPPLRPAVVAVTAFASLSSGAALVLAIVSDAPLSLTSVFVAVPGFVALVALSVWARREQQAVFLTRLRGGLAAGVLATAAYDVSRWAVEALNLVSVNTFQAIRIFGFGLTGRPIDDGRAIAAGWAFHVVNGVGFALAYFFVAAGRRWWIGLIYALGLEAWMIALYPGWLGFSMNGEFLSVSMFGHVAYGAVLGTLASRAT